MRVIVDLRRCQGHGRCYDLAPDVFEPDERGHVDVAVLGDLPAVLQPDARIGVRNCPESALRLSAESSDSCVTATAGAG
jgi:ferredoxin